METLLLKETEEDITKAAEIIKNGGIVAFPTETVYGLGADAFNEDAVKKIYKAKGRPKDNPTIVHISSQDQMWLVAEDIPNIAYELSEKFWPGPFTMVLEKNSAISKKVTGGLSTIAIRFPRNKTAQKLIELTGPIAAPSANLSGKPSGTKAKHIFSELKGKVDAIIDGRVEVGLESTVVDLTKCPYVLLRPGKISFEELEDFLGKGNIVKYEEIDGKKVVAKCPGMKYAHYAPKAKVILTKGEKIQEIIDTYNEEVIIVSKGLFNEEKVRKCFVYTSKEELGKNIFDWFRMADRLGVKTIIVEEVDEVGLGLAIMNRLKKAASEIIE